MGQVGALGPGWTTGPAATASAVGCKATLGSRRWKLLSWLTLDSSGPKVMQGLHCPLRFPAAVWQVPQQRVRASAEQQVSYSKWPNSSSSLALGGHICHTYNTYNTLKPWSSRLVLDWLLASTRLLFLGGEVLEGPIPVSGPVLRGSGVVISS